MTHSAQVRSTEAIESFRGALAHFEQRAQDAIEMLQAELQRAVEWVEHDRPSYWKKQTHRAEQAVHDAKLELERCLMTPVAGERPACREQRANLKKVQARLATCREKSERLKHWKRQLHHEMFEYTGRVSHLKRILETELPMARVRLRQIVRRLDAYQIERPPGQPLHKEP